MQIVTPAAPEPAAAAATPADQHGKQESDSAGVPFTQRVPEFFGDQAPIGSLRNWLGGNGRGVLYVPSARYFKISDDDSPLPQTRTYFSFNYLYNVGDVVNQAAGGGIQHTRIHREIWGIEFADGENNSSIGLRLPLDTYNANHTAPGLDAATTDLGDLSIIFKDVYWRDRCSGSLLSGGLEITAPTATGSFAGANYLKVFHNPSLQPFCGWIWKHDGFYVQGFTAVDVPTDLNDVVMLSNDLAVGYFLLQKPHNDGLTAVVPTVEVHVNTPLNHRGVLDLNDPAGTPDMVDVTAGIHFEYEDHSSVGLAFALPVAGPRMFDFEVLVQLRVRY